MDDKKILLSLNDTMGRIERILAENASRLLQPDDKKTNESDTPAIVPPVIVSVIPPTPKEKSVKPKDKSNDIPEGSINKILASVGSIRGKITDKKEEFKDAVKSKPTSVGKVASSDNTLTTIATHVETIVTKMDELIAATKEKSTSNGVDISKILNIRKIKSFDAKAEKGAGIFNKVTRKIKIGILNFADDPKSKRGTVSQGLTNMALFGTVFVKFSRQMMIGSIMLIPGMIGIPIMLLAMKGMSMAFKKAGGRDSKNIIKGTRVIGGMGKAMISFSLGVISFSLGIMAVVALTKGVSGGGGFMAGLGALGAIGIGMFAMWGFSKLFSSIGSGKSSKNIMKGALAMGAMSLSIVLFGYSIKNFSDNIAKTKDKWSSLAFLGVSIAGLGLVFGIVGAFKTNILWGSLSVAAMSVSLFVFGYGLQQVFENPFFNEGNKWENLGFLSASIVGVGLVMAGVGLASGLILVGAIAMLATGAALIVLGNGIESMITQVQKVAGNGGIKKFGEDFAIMMAGIGTGMMAFTDPSSISPDRYTGIGSGLLSLGKAAGNTVKILASAAALLASGVALKKLGTALVEFDKTEILSKPKEEVIAMGEGLQNFFVSFGNAFSIDGKQAMRILMGTQVMRTAATALISVSRGLIEWRDNAIAPSELILSKNGGVTLLDGIVGTLQAIQVPFAAIGGAKPKSKFGSILNDMFGAGNLVKRGIDAVMGTQGALTSVSKGLKAWQDNAIPAEQLKITSGGTTLLDSIVNTINAIREPFAALGGAKPKKGFIGSALQDVFGAENTVKIGIDAVMGTQKALSSIALGLKQFKGFSVTDLTRNATYDADSGEWVFNGEASLIDNVLVAVGLVPSIFSKIGQMNDSSKAGFWGISIGKGDIEKGKAIVNDSFGGIKDLADTLTTFKTFGESGGSVITVMDSITTAISAYLMGIGGIYTKLDDEDKLMDTGDSEELTGMMETSKTLLPMVNGLITFKVKSFDAKAKKAEFENMEVISKLYFDVISNVKKSGEDHKLNEDSLESFKQLEEYSNIFNKIYKNTEMIKPTSKGFKLYTSFFTQLEKLPTDKLKDMFIAMKETLIAMKEVNEGTMEKYIEMFERQVEAFNGVARNTKQKTNINTSNTKTSDTTNPTITTDPATASGIMEMKEILSTMKEELSEINDNLLSGAMKIKIGNLNEINI